MILDCICKKGIIKAWLTSANDENIDPVASKSFAFLKKNYKFSETNILIDSFPVMEYNDVLCKHFFHVFIPDPLAEDRVQIHHINRF